MGSSLFGPLRQVTGAKQGARRARLDRLAPVKELAHIGAGEVVGLLGDNGAGKSTQINLMSGIVRPDDGEVLVDGAPAIVKSRRDSERIGIETIYQDTALVDTMSIVRNIFMGREITNSWGFLNHRLMREIAADVLGSGIHISGIDSPDKEFGDLSGGQKQAAAIARAVYFKRRILLLEEPTSTPSARETEAVLNYIKQLRAENVSSVLVTHNLYHAYQVRPLRGHELWTESLRRGQR
jgi:simple sugar transport system ATP-binding protein